MDWNQLYHKKEDWQKEAFNMIKRNLISARDNRFIGYDNAAEEHLVMIYGKSQVGKTTLILNMIGLKEKYFPEVYETLRAGVPLGNSSTSTAIIYSKSENKKYGCSYGSINDLSVKEVKYFDKAGMSDHLKRVRQDVENNRADPNGVLNIYIPSNYFINDNDTDHISILDMPGIESRNHREDLHVQDLMTKYVPLSSVCIITCRANDIQSLETTVLPYQRDWKLMSHRFILVITYAFSDGNMKRYFQAERSERKERFYDSVNGEYKREIRKILGEKNQTEVYPVEVGGSLKTFLDQEIKNNADRQEIVETKDRILADLRRSIVSHKGERLRSALSDLRAIVDNYGQAELNDIKENQIPEFRKKKKDLESLINKQKDRIDELNDEKKDTENEKEELQKTQQELESKLSNCISYLPGRMVRFLAQNSLFKVKRDGRYLNCEAKVVLDQICADVEPMIDEYLKSLNDIIDNIEEPDVYVDINHSEVTMNVYNCIYAEEDKLSPKRGIFQKKRVCETDFVDICDHIQININNILNESVNKYISTVDSKLSEKRAKIDSIDRINAAQKRNIEKYKNDVHEFDQEIKRAKEREEYIIEKKKRDNETLDMWLNNAAFAYERQRKNIIQQLNESRKAEDKTMLLLFLGLLDKDYQRVTGGKHENVN